MNYFSYKIDKTHNNEKQALFCCLKITFSLRTPNILNVSDWLLEIPAYARQPIVKLYSKGYSSTHEYNYTKLYQPCMTFSF